LNQLSTLFTPLSFFVQVTLLSTRRQVDFLVGVFPPLPFSYDLRAAHSASRGIGLLPFTLIFLIVPDAGLAPLPSRSFASSADNPPFSSLPQAPTAPSFRACSHRRTHGAISSRRGPLKGAASACLFFFTRSSSLTLAY